MADPLNDPRAIDLIVQALTRLANQKRFAANEYKNEIHLRYEKESDDYKDACVLIVEYMSQADLLDALATDFATPEIPADHPTMRPTLQLVPDGNVSVTTAGHVPPPPVISKPPNPATPVRQTIQLTEAEIEAINGGDGDDEED